MELKSLRKSFRLVWGWLLIASLFGGTAFAQRPTLAKYLPADAYWSAETDDLAAFDQAWKKTDAYRLFCEPAMQPFFDDVRVKRPGAMPHDWLGLRWQEMLDAQVKEVLWGTMPSTQVGGVATLMIFPAKDEALFDKLQTQFTATWKERGANVGPVKFGETPATGAVTPAKRYCYLYKGADAIVLCDKSDAMTKLMTQQAAGSKPAFAEGKEFQATQSTAHNESHLRWHLRPFPYWKALHTDESDKSRRIRDRIDFYERQGFDVITGIGGGVRFGLKEHEAEHQIRIVRTGPLQRGAGMLNLLTGKSFPLPDWFPSSISSITGFHWDVPKVIDAYAHVYDETYGDGNEGVFEDTLTDIEEATDGPQAKLRGDVLKRMGPLFLIARDWGSEAKEVGSDGKKLPKRRTLWISPSNDADKSATAFERFYDGDEDFAFETIQVDGKPVKVWISSDPNVLMLGKNDDDEGEDRPLTPQIAAICVVRGHVFASSDKDYLLDLLQNKAPAAKQETKSHFSQPAAAETCGRYWRNVLADAWPVFERIKTNQLDDDGAFEQQILHRLLVADRSDAPHWKPVEGKLLPPFAAIEKYFSQLHGSIQPEADGWSFSFHSNYSSTP